MYRLTKEIFSEIESRNKYFLRVVSILLVSVVFVYIFSIVFVGRYRIDLLKIFSGQEEYSLILGLRLLRVSFALLAGAVLASSGAAMQSLFRNPLASPDVIGVSQGAAFGVALGILLLSYNYLLIEAIAFLTALLSLLMTISLSRLFRYGDEVLRLVLAGIAVSAIFSSGVGYIKYIADPYNKLPQIIFWLLGSFSTIKWVEMIIFTPMIIVSLVILVLFSWRLNILSLGDEEARALGIRPSLNRIIVILAVVLGVSSVTCVAGIISWIGLVTPHIIRSLVGAENRRVIISSMLLGSSLMILADDLARSLIESELPLNIVTSVLMIPIFILLLSRRRW